MAEMSNGEQKGGAHQSLSQVSPGGTYLTSSQGEVILAESSKFRGPYWSGGATGLRQGGREPGGRLRHWGSLLGLGTGWSFILAGT